MTLAWIVRKIQSCINILTVTQEILLVFSCYFEALASEYQENLEIILTNYRIYHQTLQDR